MKVTPERSRWVLVVRVERPEVVLALRRTFAKSAWVDVVVAGGGNPPLRGPLVGCSLFSGVGGCLARYPGSLVGSGRLSAGMAAALASETTGGLH